MTGKLEELKKDLQVRIDVLTSSGNLFVSTEDSKAVKKLAAKWDKDVVQLEVKMAGLVSGSLKKGG